MHAELLKEMINLSKSCHFRKVNATSNKIYSIDYEPNGETFKVTVKYSKRIHPYGKSIQNPV